MVCCTTLGSARRRPFASRTSRYEGVLHSSGWRRSIVGIRGEGRSPKLGARTKSRRFTRSSGPRRRTGLRNPDIGGRRQDRPCPSHHGASRTLVRTARWASTAPTGSTFRLGCIGVARVPVSRENWPKNGSPRISYTTGATAGLSGIHPVVSVQSVSSVVISCCCSPVSQSGLNSSKGEPQARHW